MNDIIGDAVARLHRLIQEAETAKNPALVKMLTDTLVRATKEQDRRDLLHNRLLSKSAVERVLLEVVRELGKIIAEEAPELHNTIVDRFMLSVCGSLTAAANTPKEIRAIELR